MFKEFIYFCSVISPLITRVTEFVCDGIIILVPDLILMIIMFVFDVLFEAPVLLVSKIHTLVTGRQNQNGVECSVCINLII